MYTIDPCCAKRHLMELRDAIGNRGTKQFVCKGDLSLTELLPALLTRYSETDLLIAAPALPDQAAEIIGMWMRKQWRRMDDKGKLDVIRRLTIVADLSAEKSPVASGWLAGNPFGERLSLVDLAQEDTAILLPDFAVTGPVNMQYGRSFTATATADSGRVRELWDRFLSLAVAEEPEREEKEDKEAGEAPEADRRRKPPVRR